MSAPSNINPVAGNVLDTQISGLTYIFASSAKEVENLVLREFHSDPNLHKNPNVQLIGDYATDGSPSVQFSWTWKWRPPKSSEDRGGGWRNSCSFVEYNPRADRLETLANFTFWVQNTPRYLAAPKSPRMELNLPPRLRVPSAQSIESRISNVSDSEGEGSYKDAREPQSPIFETIPENGLGLAPVTTTTSNATTIAAGTVKVDVPVCKPEDDPTLNEDGPLFRATMRSLEQKTGNMRLRMKRVLRTAEAAEIAQQTCNQAVGDFTQALKDAATSNANAVQPALEHYFNKIAREILQYERQNTVNLQRLVIDPVSRLYNLEIKQADYKKREFDEESKEYYSYVGKYLGQRTESLKEKKQRQSDEKYQAKRRTFELKRFDYSSFMHDLHGGRKDQEVLSQLTKYADAQAKSYLATAKKIEDMVPQLDALVSEVRIADQDYQLQRKEREEKRRALETSTKGEDGGGNAMGLSHSTSVRDQPRPSDVNELSRSASVNATGLLMSTSPPVARTVSVQSTAHSGLSTSMGSAPPPLPMASPNSKFKGIRDLEEQTNSGSGGTHRKEGLLWALSRPGSDVDPKGIIKPGWHKFWIVLDQGKLSEYVNWKDKLDLHREAIDLRMASVREARNSDRRFCFEVITPQFMRVYQAPAEEDMRSWIAAINNALQSAFENKSSQVPAPLTPEQPSSTRKDIASVLIGKGSSFSGHRQVSNPNRHAAASAVSRHSTIAEKPPYKRSEASDHEALALLQRIRSVDEGNKFCADCGSDSKVDWCSINLGILLCIECSGIHRSLGTHISKVRSLTLDTSAFTPDIVEILILVGNRVSNLVWEAKLDQFLKPAPHSTRDQRLHFITAKYGDRTYVQNSTGTLTPDENLITSIKRNDMHSVLHALAQRANPNAHDRSRATHAVYLALAAADPAAPAGGFYHSHSPSTSSLRMTNPVPAAPSTSAPVGGLRKPFAMAELLLQNGADIPSQPAPIPLTPAARLYLEFKTEQRLGRSQVSAGRDSNGDNISALPQVLPNGSMVSAGGMNGLSSEGRPRDAPQRLLKRNSRDRPRSRASQASDALEGLVKK
jgi:Arf-GAP/SH3 domain/ANK repeat/PH domain-containing protein